MAYIDRETALQIIDNYAKAVTDDGKIIVDAVRDIVAVITPTAEVEEVRHGLWIEVDQTGRNSRHIKYTTKKCSVCGYCNGRRKTKRCPECGAKMDGGKNENV